MLALTIEDLHSMFRYDPITGNLYWKVSLANGVKVGDEVGRDFRVLLIRNPAASEIHKDFFHNGIRKNASIN